MPEPSVNVTPLAELQREGVAAPSYALEWTSQAELLGYYIAENRLTKYYQTDLSLMSDSSPASISISGG